MTLRTLSALCVLALVSGCQWEGRPDGADANHSASDGYYDTEGAPQATPLGGIDTQAEVIEPLGDPVAAPVPLTQPPPTTGTTDSVSAVEEALTPGN